jgi:uncharacterized protein YjbJ (UPF0337 family)
LCASKDHKRRQHKVERRPSVSEKAKGKAKEAYGALSGDEGKKAEGQAQQRKASAREEREQQKRTKAEQDKAKRAEKSRDKQRRKDKGGLLGNL